MKPTTRECLVAIMAAILAASEQGFSDPVVYAESLLRQVERLEYQEKEPAA